MLHRLELASPNKALQRTAGWHRLFLARFSPPAVAELGIVRYLAL